ncbi:MAG: pyridoxamine 5'-phosphate oxidase family protein [Actinomycetota bacterium]|nr:pyridoxamine 5'-phosphate oxidase family protein [Actinomycetota bacterium]
MHMSEAERDAFLSQARVAVLAVTRPDQPPMVMPVWYRYVPGGGFQFTLSNDSARARMLHDIGRATLCVQEQTVPYRCVTVEGDIEMTTLETDTRETVLIDLASRYLGEDAGTKFALSIGEETEALITFQPHAWHTRVLADAGTH